MPGSAEKNDCDCKCKFHKGSPSGALYGLGVIGAAVYILQNAHGLTPVVIGLVKAVGWPAVVLYKVLGLLNL